MTISKFLVFFLAFAFTATLAGCTGIVRVPQPAQAPAPQKNPTELAQAAVAALFIDFDPEAAGELLAPDYIQHNPGVPTGAEPVLQFIPALKESGLAIETHRVFADGDLVVMHSTYTNAQAFGAPTLVGFDVFRIADGKVAEHWDNLQALAGPNASGRTMTDGPTEVTDLDQTEANKAFVAEFAQAVLIEGDFSRIADFIIGGDAFEELAAQGNALRYTKVHKIIGAGNFVLMMSEGTLGETPTAYYDLFRIENGLIVEHWDVIQEIPATMAHDNGKF